MGPIRNKILNFRFFFLDTLLAMTSLFVFLADPGVQQQYEWQREEMVYAYSQDSSFTLLAFTIPLRTLRAEFHVSLHEPEDDRLNRTVVLYVSPVSLSSPLSTSVSLPRSPPPPTRLHHPIPHTESRVFSLHEIGYDLLNSCLVKCLPSPSPPLPSTSVSPHPPSALTIPLRTQQPTATSTVMK